MSGNLKPTYVGKNDGLVFVVPQELFTMGVESEKIEKEAAKNFSKYLRGTFKGFEKARKSKYGNENNTKTETSQEFWHDFEKY